MYFSIFAFIFKYVGKNSCTKWFNFNHSLKKRGGRKREAKRNFTGEDIELLRRISLWNVTPQHVRQVEAMIKRQYRGFTIRDDPQEEVTWPVYASRVPKYAKMVLSCETNCNICILFLCFLLFPLGHRTVQLHRCNGIARRFTFVRRFPPRSHPKEILVLVKAALVESNPRVPTEARRAQPRKKR